MFDTSKFGKRRKELLWRADMHFDVSDPQLIIHLALKATDEILNGLLSQYLGRARDTPFQRSFVSLMVVLGDGLAKPGHETALAENRNMANFARKPPDAVR